MYPLEHFDAYASMRSARESIEEGQAFSAKQDLGKRMRESGGNLSEDMMLDYLSQWGSSGTGAVKEMRDALAGIAGHGGDMAVAGNKEREEGIRMEQREGGHQTFLLGQPGRDRAAIDLEQRETWNTENAGIDAERNRLGHQTFLRGQDARDWTADNSLQRAQWEHDGAGFDNKARIRADIMGAGDLRVHQFAQPGREVDAKNQEELAGIRLDNAKLQNEGLQRTNDENSRIAAINATAFPGMLAGAQATSQRQTELAKLGNFEGTNLPRLAAKLGNIMHVRVGEGDNKKEIVAQPIMDVNGMVMGYVDSHNNVYKDVEILSSNGEVTPLRGTGGDNEQAFNDYAVGGAPAIERGYGEAARKYIEESVPKEMVDRALKLQGIPALVQKGIDALNDPKNASAGLYKNALSIKGAIILMMKNLQHGGSLGSVIAKEDLFSALEPGGNIAERAFGKIIQGISGEIVDKDRLVGILESFGKAAANQHAAIYDEAMRRVGERGRHIRGFDPALGAQVVRASIADPDEAYPEYLGSNAGNGRQSSAMIDQANDVSRGSTPEEAGLSNNSQIRLIRFSNDIGSAPRQVNLGEEYGEHHVWELPDGGMAAMKIGGDDNLIFLLGQ